MVIVKCLYTKQHNLLKGGKIVNIIKSIHITVDTLQQLSGLEILLNSSLLGSNFAVLSLPRFVMMGNSFLWGPEMATVVCSAKTCKKFARLQWQSSLSAYDLYTLRPFYVVIMSHHQKN
jgi:hypothetical protein